MPVGRLPAAAGRDSSGGETAVGDGGRLLWGTVERESLTLVGDSGGETVVVVGGEGELDSRGETLVGPGDGGVRELDSCVRDISGESSTLVEGH